MTNILELSNVTKSFSQAGQKIEIIKNADFSIKSSEFLSLIGPSGSGKTTLLQICGMLDNPSSGTVIINGKNMAKANDEKRTKIRKLNIGFVYQFHHLLHNIHLGFLIMG
jgi:lipoprotein-releasing system ATP-binding protein